VYTLLITEGFYLCLKNGVINLFGIATPLVMSYSLQMGNLGKCVDFVEPRYNMSFKQMEFAVCSLVHFTAMMPV
jgi:hypothetical protein